MLFGDAELGGAELPARLARSLKNGDQTLIPDDALVGVRTDKLHPTRRIEGDELSVFRDIKTVTPKTSLDYKTLLQETLQAKKLAAPVYTLMRSEGQPHERTFYVEASWQGGTSNGSGRSIKAAEMVAANEALKIIAETNDDQFT